MTASPGHQQKKDAYVRLATRTAAMSGACAVVAHIDSNELTVASTGDCSAVIGALSQNDRWVPIKLNQEHHEENKNEVQRIISEHPGENPKHVIKVRIKIALSNLFHNSLSLFESPVQLRKVGMEDNVFKLMLTFGKVSQKFSRLLTNH